MKIVKRVKKSEFELEVEDKIAEGYKLESKTNSTAILVKRGYGRAMWHILIGLFTIWWTFGFGNLLYFLYAYFVHKDEVTVKIK